MAFVAPNDRPGCFPLGHMVECTSWPCPRNGNGTNIDWSKKGGGGGGGIDEETVEIDEVMMTIDVDWDERLGKSPALESVDFSAECTYVPHFEWEMEREKLRLWWEPRL